MENSHQAGRKKDLRASFWSLEIEEGLRRGVEFSGFIRDRFVEGLSSKMSVFYLAIYFSLPGLQRPLRPVGFSTALKREFFGAQTDLMLAAIARSLISSLSFKIE